MKTLSVYDPPMCCSTGVCGPQVDPKLVRFSADLKWLSEQHVKVQRFNLSQSPAEFVASEIVRTALQKKGESALPLLIANGKTVATGRYPDRNELCSWFGLVNTSFLKLTPNADDDCCGGGKC